MTDRPGTGGLPPRTAARRSHLRPVDALGDELDNPVEVAGAGGAGAGPVQAAGGRGGRVPPARATADGEADRPRGEIWKGCPVRAVGMHGGQKLFLDVHGQLRRIGKLDRSEISTLFGHLQPQLWARYPKLNSRSRKPVPMDFDQVKASADMTSAASECGIVDPDRMLRGPGAWTDAEGRLVYHAGDRVYLGDGTTADPGRHGPYIYPAAGAVPHPAPAISGDPFAELLDVLGTWAWQRPEIDARMAAGLMGCLMIGGALQWRPHVWLTGGAGTGKSLLQDLIRVLMGGEHGLIQTSDPSARGIAQLLEQSTMPVAIDELEGDNVGSARARGIVELARLASSGGGWVRGSTDQKASRGVIRATFVFSSVIVPGVLRSQDFQRIIVLSLDPLPDGARPPQLQGDRWGRRGAMLKRMLIDRWADWPARLEAWRAGLEARGIMGRDALNWATVLAMADAMESADLPAADVVAGWCAKVAPHAAPDITEARNDAQEVLLHLLTKPYDIFRRGEQWSVGQWVMVAARSPGAPAGLLNHHATDQQGQEARAKEANEKLGRALIRVVPHPDGARIFVGNAQAHGLLELFAGTQWAGGAWRQSLARVPGAKVDQGPRRFGAVQTKGIEIPLSAVPGLMAFPADEAPAAAPPASPYSAEDFA